MKVSAFLLAVCLASAAEAQGGTVASPPAPSAESAETSIGPNFGLIGDTAYEPGVGVRFKTPRTVLVLYGLLEPTLSYISNVNPNGDSLTGYQVSWFSGNRWGITGSQALTKDDDLKAIFRLESEFELPTGNMDTPNVLFNRDAWGGFSSELIGKVTFGRQNTLARDFSQNYGDPYGTAGVTLEEGGWTNVNNFKQLIFFAGSVTSTRYNNGLVWKRKFGKYVVAGLGYQFGETAGKFMENSSGSAGLGLNFGDLNFSGFFTEANNHGFNQHSYSIGANYRFAIVRLNAGYFRYEANQGALGQRSDDAYTFSVKVTPGGARDGFEFDLGFQRIYVNNAAVNGSGNVINQFGDTSAATKVASGGKATVYGSILYHFSRATMAYLAFDYAKVTDGYQVNGATNGVLSTNAAKGSDNQTEIALGTRIIF